jgi:ribosome-binding factor A
MSEIQRGRIEETIRQQLAELLVRRVKDPRVQSVSITAVEISKDYSVAKVMYNIVGGSEQLHEVRQGLESCRGFFRAQLTKYLRLRVTPELVFVYDASLDRAMAIEELLQRIHEEEESGEEEDQ